MASPSPVPPCERVRRRARTRRRDASTPSAEARREDRALDDAARRLVGVAPGALYEVHDWARLDRIERGYRRVPVVVLDEGNAAIHAWTYTVIRKDGAAGRRKSTRKRKNQRKKKRSKKRPRIKKQKKKYLIQNLNMIL